MWLFIYGEMNLIKHCVSVSERKFKKNNPSVLHKEKYETIFKIILYFSMNKLPPVFHNSFGTFQTYRTRKLKHFSRFPSVSTKL